MFRVPEVSSKIYYISQPEFAEGYRELKILANELEESFLMISSRDFKTGRRFLKGLPSIEIKRVL